jgi:hypothetical protein
MIKITLTSLQLQAKASQILVQKPHTENSALDIETGKYYFQQGILISPYIIYMHILKYIALEPHKHSEAMLMLPLYDVDFLRSNI